MLNRRYTASLLKEKKKTRLLFFIETRAGLEYISANKLLMDMMNIFPPDDTDYTNWSNEDYVNDVIEYLFKHHTGPSTLSQINSTKVLPDDKKKLIESLVIDTGVTNHSAAGFEEQFKIKDDKFALLSKYGSYIHYAKVEKFEGKSDQEIKHEILRFLKKDREDSFFLKDVNYDIPIDEERLIYILNEMKDDSTIGLKDVSTFEATDYLIWIEPKGLGFFTKSEYLKPKEVRFPFNQYVNYGDNVQFAGRDAIMSDIKNKTFNENEESAETKELTKKGFEISRKTLIWTIILGGIAIIVSILIALLK